MTISLAMLLIGGGLFFIFALVIFLLVFFLGRTDLNCILLDEKMNGDLSMTLPNGRIRFIKRQGSVEKWKVVGTRIPVFMPIDKSSFITGRQKDWIILLRDKDGFIHPMSPELDEKKRKLIMRPYYRDQIDWLVEETEERAKLIEKRNNWEKFAPAIGYIVAGMVVFAAIFFSFEYAGKKVDNINGAADLAEKQIEQKATQYAETIQKAADIVRYDQLNRQTTNWTKNKVPIS